MGEPIRLYDRDGKEQIMYSPTIASAMVVAGLLFDKPPVPLTPNDTQEAPVVRKPRKDKSDGGVL
jgi:hypothetical protein